LNGASDQVVLPEALVGDLIEKVGTIAAAMNTTFAELTKDRDAIRKLLLDDGRIAPSVLDESATTDLLGLAVDGASLVEVDRATSYGVSCVARVGPHQAYSAFESNMFVLPHLTNIDSLASGFMMMQEIMMACETATTHPESVVFIDGSKVTFVIKINQFYSSFREENKRHNLDEWRKPNHMSEAAVILRKFESKNWFDDLIGLPNIVGLLKLVTTDVLVRAYMPKYYGRFDDKTLAALTLERGERTVGIALRNPEAVRIVEAAEKSKRQVTAAELDVSPYHLSAEYPFSEAFEATSKLMTQQNSAHRIEHVYFNAPANGAIYKVETSAALPDEKFGQVFEWLTEQSCAVDMLEPYPMFVADRFVSEAVAISRDAISEITRTRNTSDWAWNLTGPNRS
jgi:hypothetical protein